MKMASHSAAIGLIYKKNIRELRMENYQDFNAKTIDGWNAEGWEWGTVISHEEFLAAQQGNWKIVLTPQKPVPSDWYAPFLQADGHFAKTTKILGLASGGGQQGAILSAAGASVTILDYADSQLAAEKAVAEREGYDINIVKADMTERLPFADETFDLIVHPVSNCYIEDVQPVWNEAYRVLKPGGVLLSGVDNGFNYLFNQYEAPMTIEHVLPFNPLKDEALLKEVLAGTDGIQFSHTFEEQIGGQLTAGFVLTAAFEDFYNDDSKKYHGFPEFWATRSLKMKK
jgi:SAM-dependent methyltransferase